MNKELPFPTGKIERISGTCLSLRGDDIDTDRIIPARFLKCVSFQDLGNQVFQDDREELKGSHPFDLENNKSATILIVNDNFGCGSSREHAPQALMRWGIRAIIGQSFAEIFYGNCLALGIPCGTATAAIVNTLQTKVEQDSHQVWDLEVKNKEFESKYGKWNINFDKGIYEMLVTGKWDATSQLISKSELISYKLKELPYLNSFDQK